MDVLLVIDMQQGSFTAATPRHDAAGLVQIGIGAFVIEAADLAPIAVMGGLSVLCGTTDTELVVLDRSIEWSKYALYRHEDPHFRFTVVKGNCDIYCCDSEACPVYGEFRCIPGYDAVRAAVFTRLDAARSQRGRPQ